MVTTQSINTGLCQGDDRRYTPLRRTSDTIVGLGQQSSTLQVTQFHVVRLLYAMHIIGMGLLYTIGVLIPIYRSGLMRFNTKHNTQSAYCWRAGEDQRKPEIA